MNKIRKILIVEDDEVLGRMYKKLFEFKNYDVNLVQDGLSAFSQAKKFEPNLILLDIMMPKMNGLEVLEKLKKDNETKIIPVILMTNLGIQEELDKAINNGALRYIIKNDHQPEDIFKIVEEILK